MPDPSVMIDQLLTRHALISDQVDKTELRVILSELSKSLAIHHSAVVVEFGCYVGTTSLFIKRLIDGCQPTAEFHVYDSFAGLPEKSDRDRSPAGEQFRTGELSVSRKTFELQFKKAGLRTPRIHKGWFSNLSSRDVPDTISFAYLDGDYYQSIKDSLELITPKLAPTATIIIDDYANEALPGAAKAVDAWASRHGLQVKTQASLAIIHT